VWGIEWIPSGKVVSFFKRLLKGSKAGNGDDAYKLAVRLHATRDLAGAADALRSALAADPGYERCLEIGQLSERLEDWPTAVSAYEHAVTQKQSPDAIGRLGMALAASGRLPEAIEALELACELAPYLPEAHIVLASHLLEARAPERAVRHLRRAVKLTPDDLEARLLLGSALRRAGELPAAQTELEAAAEQAPADARPRIELALAARRSGDMETARRHFELAQVLADGAAPLLVHLGLAYRELGELRTATRHFRDAVRADPHSIEARLNLGIAFFDDGLPAASTAELVRAQELAPSSTAIRYHLALALQAQGKLEDALECLGRALDIAPGEAKLRAKHDELTQALLDRPAVSKAIEALTSRSSAAIAGRLEEFAVPDLLEFLKGSRRTGVLHLSSTEGAGEVRFLSGKVTAASAPGASKLGDLLRATDEISEDALREAINRQQAENSTEPIGILLLHEGVIDLATLGETLGKQIRSVIARLVRWKQGSFAFEPAPLDQAAPTAQVALDVSKILIDLVGDQEDEGAEKKDISGLLELLPTDELPTDEQ
jgi:tetratricopeptide (TPR) repeat protein